MKRKEQTTSQFNIAFADRYLRDYVKGSIKDHAENSDMTMGGSLAVIIDKALIGGSGDDADIYRWAIWDAADRPEQDPYPKNVGIGAALERAFEQACAGINGKPAHPCALPYIQLACELSMANSLKIHTPVEHDDPRVNLRREFDGIAKLLTKHGRSISDTASEIIDSYDGNHAIWPLYRLVLDNWDILGNNNSTFHFLVYVAAAAENWQDTAEERERLRRTCSYVYRLRAEWQKEEAAKRAKKHRDAILITVELASGDTVSLPYGWLQVNPESAATSHYVGVVATTGTETEDVPGFVYFSDKPINELTTEDEDAVYADCGAIWPQIADIRSDYLKRREEGTLASGPLTTIFPVPDKGTYPFGDPPGGAEITRAKRKE